MLARILVRDARRQEPVNFRYLRPGWHDPYPYVPGTVPEKMVFAELAGRHIPFTFQALGFPPGHENDPHFVARLRDIRPDFLIPSLHIAIEIQGVYFHTQPDAQQHDLDKATEYRAWGWKVFWIWDEDILLNVGRAVEFCPQLTGGAPLGAYLPKAKAGEWTAPGATTADANAVAEANRKRARPKGIEVRARSHRGFRRQRVEKEKKSLLLGESRPLTTDPFTREAIKKLKPWKPPKPPKKARHR